MSLLLSILCLLIPSIHAIRIPVVENAILTGLSSENSSMLFNKSCYDCLCQHAANASALNCFANATCQIFPTAPRRYRVSPSIDARVLFPNGILPNKSQCCMPNLADVISKLQNGIRNNVSVKNPRCLQLDKNGILYTVEYITGFLRGYDATQLTEVMQRNLSVNISISLAENDGIFFVGLDNGSILILNGSNTTTISTIASSSLSVVRHMILLNHGETLVVASAGRNQIVFFQRISPSSGNFAYSFNQSISAMHPHGLHYVNDTFFYATSWNGITIYSYTLINETFWNGKLLINASSYGSSAAGSHVIMDECGRLWFIVGYGGFLIYDNQGSFLHSFNLSSATYIFDAILTDNYVLYISTFLQNTIARIDPNITC